ncbi:MAG: hypothetical protein V4492_07515 [Chlamydiota bacterium]
MAAGVSSPTTPCLGTFAGVPSYSPGLTGELTYTRTYHSFAKVPHRDEYGHVELMDAREQIASICAVGHDDYLPHGMGYSYTPERKRDGRAFGAEPFKTYQGGGYFLVAHTYADDDQSRFTSGLKYATQVFAKRIQEQYNESIHQAAGYSVSRGFNEFVRRYFDPIPSPEVPQDGDLAVYENPPKTLFMRGPIRDISGTAHAGIYRATEPNWNSSKGGSIESKWGYFFSKYVYDHEVFLTPDYFGATVKFYRFREIVAQIPTGHDLELKQNQVFESYSQEEKNRVYFQIWELSGRPMGDPRFGQNNIYVVKREIFLQAIAAAGLDLQAEVERLSH